MESGVATHYTKHVYMPPASKQERGGACEYVLRCTTDLSISQYGSRNFLLRVLEES